MVVAGRVIGGFYIEARGNLEDINDCRKHYDSFLLRILVLAT